MTRKRTIYLIIGLLIYTSVLSLALSIIVSPNISFSDIGFSQYDINRLKTFLGGTCNQGIDDSGIAHGDYLKCNSSTGKYEGVSITGLQVDSVTYVEIDETRLGVQRSSNCSALACYVVGTPCQQTDGSDWGCDTIGAAGVAVWSQRSCNSLWSTVKDEGTTQGVANAVENFNFVGDIISAAVSGDTATITVNNDNTNLIVDGDTTPGGLTPTNPTSVDYVCGTGLTCTTTGTDAAPVVTINEDTDVVPRTAQEFGRTNITTSMTNGLLWCPSMKIRTGCYMPWAGSIVGFGFDFNGDITAGTGDLGIAVNGAEVLDNAIAISSTVENGKITFTPGTYTFTAGQYINVTIDTDINWAPTTADIGGFLYVVFSE